MSESNPAQPLSMMQLLTGLNAGSIVAEMQDELTRVTKAVSLLDKGGKITLTINVNPSKAEGAVELSAELSSKIPKPKRGSNLLYHDGTGGLHRYDPRQMDAFANLRPRVVASARVNKETGEILDGDSQASA